MKKIFFLLIAFFISVYLTDLVEAKLITNADIAKNAGISYGKLKLKGKIDKDDLEKNSVTSKKIKNGSIKGKDITSELEIGDDDEESWLRVHGDIIGDGTGKFDNIELYEGGIDTQDENGASTEILIGENNADSVTVNPPTTFEDEIEGTTGDFTSLYISNGLDAQDSSQTIHIGESVARELEIGHSDLILGVNSGTWDVSTAGVGSGFTGFTSTGTVNFSGASSLRVPNATSGGTCDGSHNVGGIYFDTDDYHFYGCNGSSWVQLDYNPI